MHFETFCNRQLVPRPFNAHLWWLPGSLFRLTADKKLLRVMKLTAALLMALCLHVSATGVSQNISFSGTNVPLKQVFRAIEQQTGYVIFYDENLLAGTKPVSIN